MDQITENLLDDFVAIQELGSIGGDPIKFEYFCNYSIVSKEYSESFDIESISTNHATGIDGLAILVNGRLVESTNEIDDLLWSNKYLEVIFIFIQAKTSNNFNAGDMNTFFFAVNDFFNENQTLPQNENIKAKNEIKKYLYSKSANMTRGLPQCKLYYVTTGVWTGETALQAVCDAGKASLENRTIFEKVFLNQLGAKEIQKYYHKTKEVISRDIMFTNKVVMPEIDGVNEAYIGTVSFKEFKKLITDEEDKILSSIFYDNIRAFQGDNVVNEKIKNNLESGGFDKFVVLNNGITIVARSIIPAGNKFTINNYQIVNGCQTSHVLYNLRNLEGVDNVSIPIKLIVSSNEDLINQVITATNSQTAVKPEELEALSEFQKNLERFYATTKEEGKLYYERRSKQYSTDPLVTKTRIVSIPTQIKCFAAMFLQEPHRVSRYYGSIIKELGGKIFATNHKPIAYYTCAYAYYKFDQKIRTGVIDRKYKKCGFHVLMMLPYLIGLGDPPVFNSSTIESYCSKIIPAVVNDNDCMDLFNKATKIIDGLSVDLNNRDEFKKQTTTDLILGKIKK